jgi:hypothetical protein
MEPDVSLPCSKQSATGPYRHPVHIVPTYFFKIRSTIILPSKSSSSLEVFQPK